MFLEHAIVFGNKYGTLRAPIIDKLKKGRDILFDIVNKTAKNLNIPLCVGGGIRSIENIENILNSGADKISINTAFIENPKLVSLAAKKFGSSTISASIEYIRIDKRVYISKANGRDLV